MRRFLSRRICNVHRVILYFVFSARERKQLLPKQFSIRVAPSRCDLRKSRAVSLDLRPRDFDLRLAALQFQAWTHATRWTDAPFLAEILAESALVMRIRRFEALEFRRNRDSIEGARMINYRPLKILKDVRLNKMKVSPDIIVNRVITSPLNQIPSSTYLDNISLSSLILMQRTFNWLICRIKDSSVNLLIFLSFLTFKKFACTTYHAHHAWPDSSMPDKVQALISCLTSSGVAMRYGRGLRSHLLARPVRSQCA